MRRTYFLFFALFVAASIVLRCVQTHDFSFRDFTQVIVVAVVATFVYAGMERSTTRKAPR